MKQNYNSALTMLKIDLISLTNSLTKKCQTGQNQPKSYILFIKKIYQRILLKRLWLLDRGAQVAQNTISDYEIFSP